jgi:Uma2 family endonuclease
MAASIIEHMARGDAPPYVPLTVEQYHRLNESGDLPDGLPCELIDGLLVYKDRRDDPGTPLMTHGPNHATVVAILQRIVDRLVEAHGCHARCQLPITLPPGNEPEPDVSVITGTFEDYRRALPRATDTWAVIEVADSSVSFDRTTKLRVYSGAGVPTYVIVDLRRNRFEVHTLPVVPRREYDRCEILERGDEVRFDVAGNAVTFLVDDVLA